MEDGSDFQLLSYNLKQALLASVFYDAPGLIGFCFTKLTIFAHDRAA
jgi:hypothetical protein